MYFYEHLRNFYLLPSLKFESVEGKKKVSDAYIKFCCIVGTVKTFEFILAQPNILAAMYIPVFQILCFIIFTKVFGMIVISNFMLTA